MPIPLLDPFQSTIPPGPHRLTQTNIKPIEMHLHGVDFGDVGDQVKDAARVTPLIVVPGDNLDEVVVLIPY